MRKITLILFLIHFAAGISATTESEKINQLLLSIESSNLIFIRNGVEYSSKQARAHLEYKLSKAGNKIIRAEDFIRSIASRSSFTGTPYYIKYPNGEIIKNEEWLRQKLYELERNRKSPPEK